MHSAKRVVARGDTGDRPVFHDSSPRSAAVVQAEKVSAVEHDDLRGECRGGRPLSAQVGAAEVVGSPTSPDSRAENVNRQYRLLDRPPVSVVSYGRLKELAQARVRRVVREMDFDWERFLDGKLEWSLTEVIHRKAMQDATRRGLDVRPTDVPTDTVLKAVRAVLEEMDADPALRPSEAGFRAEQARRGELGREAQSVEVREREAAVMKLVAGGVTKNTEIAEVVGVRPSTVGRIRKRVAEREQSAEQFEALKWVFPAEDVPAGEHWPAVQFVKQTGVYLDEDQARWICDIGRCYNAEGREADLMRQIQMSAGAADPWAYLERCVANRGDAWTVTAQLLADVLTWAGKQSLQYALTAIGGGYVSRPLPYLRRTLHCAVSAGQRPAGGPERPVAMALAMCRQWALDMVVVDADEAVAAEDAAARVGHIESYRRRFGRLPWEADEVAPDCCNGLNGVRGDEFNSLDPIPEYLYSSPEPGKADATLFEPDLECRVGPEVAPVACSEGGGQQVQDSPLLGRGKLEHPPETADLPGSDGIRLPQGDGEVAERGRTASGLLPQENRPPVLEQGPCRHPLVALLTAGIVLEAVVQVECSAGCGHRLYSDRGSFECPCHWPAAKAASVGRALAAAEGSLSQLSDAETVLSVDRRL